MNSVCPFNVRTTFSVAFSISFSSFPSATRIVGFTPTFSGSRHEAQPFTLSRRSPVARSKMAVV